MNIIVRNIEIIAAMTTAGFLLLGHFVIRLPLWVNLPVSGALFLGFYLIGSSWFEIQFNREAGNLTAEVLRNKVGTGMQKVSTIRGLANSIADSQVKNKILGIAELSDRMLRNFAQNPGDLGQAGRFLLYLDKFLPLIERYARLSGTPEGRELLLKTSDDAEFWELLHTAEESFTENFQSYLQNDAVELRTLGRTLKKMMNVPQIGK